MSKLQNILGIVDAALKGLAQIQTAATPAGIADIFVHILQGGLAAYQAETGQPLDVTKLHQETPVA